MTQLLPRFRRRQAEYKTPPSQNDPPTPSTPQPATAAGDPRRLRGIPAIGRNVTGAIPGSSPGAALLADRR